MSAPQCTVGIDFGTESARALLLDAGTGEELGVQVARYASGVIDRTLPSSGEALPPDWALQDPDDWVSAVESTVPALLAQAGVGPEQVRGLGIDFTSCTVLPCDSDGVPLCRHERWREHRHAWPKLWKHHAAQPVADRINEVARERGESFLDRYGGAISSEWYFPKLISVWGEDPDVYAACDEFLEGADWIVWHLTGQLRRQRCTAAYKAMWSAEEGLPSREYFEAAFPGFGDPAAKLGHEFLPLGACAGHLAPEVAKRLGLSEQTAVAVGNVDSFVSVPGAGVNQPETFVTVIGTSICDMVLGTEEIRLPGITGVAAEGILPGLFGYEAGQAAVGDMLAWFVRTLGRGADAYAELEAQAAELAPGETGLVVLDWLNGNRSILSDADLTGVIFGLTLSSTPVHIYRALLESIAFGNRRIMDNFVEHGVPLSQIVACGGIAHRSPLAMQLIADVSGRPVHVPASSEIPARGAALFGAVAAGLYEGIEQAVHETRQASARTYQPDPTARAAQDRVYGIYRQLYELLGSSRPELMHELKRMRTGGQSQ